MEFTTQATVDLRAIDQKVAQLIYKKIKFYCTAPDPFAFASQLQEPFKGQYRFRIGDYRVLFRKKPSGEIIILFILRVKHRSEAYD